MTDVRSASTVAHNPGWNSVKLDGCAVWHSTPPIHQAKEPDYTALNESTDKSLSSQIKSIMTNKGAGLTVKLPSVAQGQPIERHAAEEAATHYFDRVVRESEIVIRSIDL